MNKPFLHQFTLDGYHLVLDVNSGTLHAVTPLVAKLLEQLTPPLGETLPAELFENLSGYDRELVGEAYSEIYTLWKEGTLWGEFDESVNIDYETLPLKALCLHIAHDCNMHCDYCFAATGSYHGARSLMSAETARRAMDFLFEQSKSRKNLEVDFFGGEPLLNLDVVKDCVAYTRAKEKEYGKTVRFTLTTNALELDEETAAFLNREMYNLVFSVDGRKKTHEAMRHANNGEESYDRILNNIRATIKDRGDKSWYARGTFTHKNLDFRADATTLADSGISHLSLEPVVLNGEDPLAIRESDLPAIFLEYERLAREIIRREERARKSPPGMPFEFFHFSVDLDGGPCAYKRLKGCGSGTEYLAVSPTGELYPCHQFVGDKDFLLGTLETGIIHPEVKKRFCHSPVLVNEPCKDCFSKYFCSGGCAANNYKINGNLEKPYEIGCKLQRKRLECALMIRAARAFDEDIRRKKESL